MHARWSIPFSFAAVGCCALPGGLQAPGAPGEVGRPPDALPPPGLRGALLDVVPRDGWAPPDVPAEGLYRIDLTDGARTRVGAAAPGVDEDVVAVTAARGAAAVLVETSTTRLVRRFDAAGVPTDTPAPNPEPRVDSATWTAALLGDGSVGFTAALLDISNLHYRLRVRPPGKPELAPDLEFVISPVVAWAPDAVVVSRAGDAGGPVVDCAWRLPLDGGAPERLWCFDRQGATLGGITEMAMAPDGHHLAAVIGGAGEPGTLYVGDTPGELARVTFPTGAPVDPYSAHGGPRALAWAPDSAHLAVLADQDGPCWGDRLDRACSDALYVVSADGSGAARFGPYQPGGGVLAWGAE